MESFGALIGRRRARDADMHSDGSVSLCAGTCRISSAKARGIGDLEYAEGSLWSIFVLWSLTTHVIIDGECTVWIPGFSWNEQCEHGVR